MSDGPFKNLKLGKCWKRFAEAIQNDANNSYECSGLANDAILNDILIDGVKGLLSVLHAYAKQKQFDLDPLSSVEKIFNANIRTPFIATLQKELVFRIHDQIAPSDAIRQALEASVGDHIGVSISRIEDACIIAREEGKMRQDQFDHTINQSSAILGSLSKNDICDALLAGDKKAFKAAAKKKKGLDEGPCL